MKARHRRLTAGAAVAVLACLSVIASPVSSAGGRSGDISTWPSPAGAESTTPLRPGLDSELSDLVDRATAQPGSPERLGPGSEFVEVVISAEVGRGTVALLAATSAGAPHTSLHGNTVFATVSVHSLTALAANPAIRSIRTPAIPEPNVLGQGVAHIGANDWHAEGIDGTGVRVAVIDVGFAGYRSLLGSDLPPVERVTTWNGCSLGFENQDHGTAVAEIVHEVAPGAHLYLMCIDSSNDLANAVDYAIAQGVRVINQSLGWSNVGRGDGTGIIGDIVATAHAGGIRWVNSAGNSAQRHWGGSFRDTDSDGWHEFLAGAPNDPANINGPYEVNEVSLPHNGLIRGYLRWDDWPSTAIDLDLRLYRVAGDTLVLVGEYSPNATAPTEDVAYVNTSGSTQTLVFLVKHVSGALPADLQIDLFTTRDLQHQVAARSITDPAPSPLVTAVGAVCWSNDTIRSYSSRGPTIDGSIKPDLAGPDGVSNATYGTTNNCNGGFTGTSASSPHAAGAAALLQQAYPAATTEDIHQRLITLTREAGVAGEDNDYGAGILSLGDPPNLETLPVGLVDPLQGQWHLRNSSGAVTSFYFGNPGDFPIMGDWNCNGVDTPGMYRQSDGFVYLRNTNTQGIANIRFFFGNPGDIPIAGDFNNNNCDTVSIYRPSNQTFYIINQLGQNDGGLGAADFSYVFGNPGDKPFVGDFNGNGQDTIGLHRESTGFVYYRNTHTQGNADNQFFFGDPNDRFITGDWNTNGIDSPGIFRPGNTTFYFRYTNTQGNANEQFIWGSSGWLPVSGAFGLG